MKRFVMWLCCWGFYLCGDIVSKLDRFDVDWLTNRWYPLYCWLMWKSCYINDKYGFEVWLPSKSQEE